MERRRQARPLRTAQVTSTEQITPGMVRLHLSGDDLRSIGRLQHTDAYVKLLFARGGGPYRTPFDPAEVRERLPRELWPVTRTYTLRWHDAETGRASIDFVVHGDAGLAGPWALRASAGETIGFYGPGGAWSPDLQAHHHLFVGDESAAPAIAAGLDALPHGARATVFLEVDGPAEEYPLRVIPGLDVHWVHREGDRPGVRLAEAVRDTPSPLDDTGLQHDLFVHGNADMVRAVRRNLLVERGLPRAGSSISGYWRPGHDEDAWQAGKREFVAQMEQDQPA